MNKREKKPKDYKEFVDVIDIINVEIYKRRNRWNLGILAWMDFEDVAQIIRFHIFKKWHLYNQKRKLAPWVNRIITNQIKNLIRNNYSNFVKPCAKCAAAEGDSDCAIYKKQCGDCPLYKNWERNKKSAFETKMPVPLEHYSQELYFASSHQPIDIERAAENLHARMREVLKPNEWIAYRYLYIENKDEEEVAILMGFKTTEKNRSPGYKQIKNLKKAIIKKAKLAIQNDEVDI
jgi:DNA-directed RNA polymerase specialized sigma24 family protein